MIELVRPTVDLAQSWWLMADSFGDALVHGSGYRAEDREMLSDPEAFEAWVNWLALAETPGEHLGESRVPAAYRWIVEDGVVVGTITLRHELNDMLLSSGGHIGYAVAPSARRRGVATAALVQALRMAAVRRLDPVLVTCEDDNVASARTIEAAGGVLEDVRGGLRRYWVCTGARAEPLSLAPIETSSCRLVVFSADDIATMLRGDTRPNWADGYPREDDLDAAGLVREPDPWSPRHITRREDDVVVGSIGCFGPPGDDGWVEVGYGLVEAARGTGLMTDALAALCRAIEAGGHRVLAHTLPDNVASHRVLARLGFARVGEDDGEWRWVRAGDRSPSGRSVEAAGQPDESDRTVTAS